MRISGTPAVDEKSYRILPQSQHMGDGLRYSQTHPSRSHVVGSMVYEVRAISGRSILRILQVIMDD